MMIVGLTGGIASGKSLVASLLSERHVPIIDTDEIARQVVAPGQPAWQHLRDAFGPEFFCPTGELDRAALARCVFADPTARRRLESLTHPAIFAEVDRQLATLRAQPEPPPVVVVVVPLLFEIGAETRFDRTVVVATTAAQQRDRLQARRGYTATEADARLAAQLPLADKIARADACIDNSGTIAHTRTQVDALLRRLRRAARA